MREPVAWTGLEGQKSIFPSKTSLKLGARTVVRLI